MTEPWLESVEEHRETLEKLADSELPLSDECRELLAEADGENVANQGGEAA